MSPAEYTDDTDGAADTLDALLAGRGPALVDGDRRLSAADIEHMVDEEAARLAAAGVTAGHTVAWQLPNTWESVVRFRACWRLGATAVPIHHRATPAEVNALLARLGPPARPRSGRLTVTVIARHPDLGVGGGGAAVGLFTAGSTGQPKLVLHTHAALAHKARQMVAVHGLGPGDVVLMPAPLAHVSGLLNGILLPGAAGMTTVLMAAWNPDAALDLIERERVTYMIGPPTFFTALTEAPTFTSERVASLRLVSGGGAGMTPAFVERMSAALGARVKRTYGSTEAPTITTWREGDPPERAATTDGRPLDGVELRLGPTGELLVRGPELFAGYDDRAATAEALTPDGWFRTGDLATIDTDGWLTITGRLKDVIIRGGENIAPAEVEAVLEAHPAIRQAVAVGYPDERYGERVAAVVVAEGAVDLAAVQAWFAERGVARYKTPERVLQVDALPLLPAGKPDRAAVRALVAP